MFKLLILASLIPLAIQQQVGCNTCGSSSSNYDLTAPSSTNHAHSSGSYRVVPPYHQYPSSATSSNSQQTQSDTSSSQIPGFLPNYQGDRHTFQSRREETLRLNQEFWNTQGGGSSSQVAQSPQYQPTPSPRSHSKKFRQIPIVFADPENIDTDEPFFIEIDDADVEYYTSPEPTESAETSSETPSKNKNSPQNDYINFDIEPNGKLVQNGEITYESEATRAMVEALQQHDPKYIQSDLKLEFVPS